MKHTTTAFATAGVTALLHALPALAADFAFEFNTDSVLPTSQGALYTGVVPESSVFSVSDGVLRQNAATFGFDVLAVYLADFNPLQDATLSWRVQVINAQSPFGVNIGLQGLGLLWDFNLGNDGIYAFGNGFNRIVSMDTTDGFHSYEVVTHGGSANYELLVDGISRYSGAAGGGGSFTPYSRWGDMTGTGAAANGAANWDYVRLANPVPEPSSVALLALGTVTLIFLRRKRQRG